MERRTRVYPAEKQSSGWLSTLLLLLAAVVLVSGLVKRGEDAGISIRRLATATPIPMDAAFDETTAQKEMVLPASRWYALQMGVFEDEAGAESFAEQYVARGAGGYVWHDGRYRVLAAVYPLKEDAQLVRQQLETQHGVDTYLYEVDLPALEIRLNGMQGQLDILEAAFIHANDLIRRMQQLSVGMDRREASSEETLAQLHTLSEQVELVSLRMKQRFSAPRHTAVETLINCFDGYSAFCQQVRGGETAVSLGAALKWQTLSALQCLKRVYDTLQHT